jgi:hypothetical protein
MMRFDLLLLACGLELASLRTTSEATAGSAVSETFFKSLRHQNHVLQDYSTDECS